MRKYKSFFLFITIIGFLILLAIIILASLSKWEKDMVERNMSLCESFASGLVHVSEPDLFYLGEAGVLDTPELGIKEMRLLDSVLKRNPEKYLLGYDGLDGGFYLSAPNAFFGYAFPTSPPPVPAYGPPPRSYEIIREQSIKTTRDNTVYCELQGFDAALFPLATVPVVYNHKVVGAVWVRIHLEKQLPVVKLRQILYRTALISIAGFTILMVISLLWSAEMRAIKREIINIRNNPGYRLSKRRWIFGYLSDSINRMLDTIESELSKRRALEKELHQKEKMAYLGNLVAGVAHEVKTPLSIIKTRLQIWQKEIADGKNSNPTISSDSMRMLIGETDRLANLVNRLLIFASPIDKKTRPVDINSIITGVAGMMSQEINDKQVVIETRLSNDLPLITIDQSSVKQVLINVVSNAVDSVRGNGKITIFSGIDTTGEMIIIEVADNGMGIPHDKLDNIFEPFFTLKENGVGLGLAISYQIIKAHNGDIVLQNNPDRGASCIIRLPI